MWVEMLRAWRFPRTDALSSLVSHVLTGFSSLAALFPFYAGPSQASRVEFCLFFSFFFTFFLSSTTRYTRQQVIAVHSVGNSSLSDVNVNHSYTYMWTHLDTLDRLGP